MTERRRNAATGRAGSARANGVATTAAAVNGARRAPAQPARERRAKTQRSQPQRPQPQRLPDGVAMLVPPATARPSDANVVEGNGARPSARRAARRPPPAAKERAAAEQVEAQPVPREPDVFDERVAGALAFLRRRLTGDYAIDEFGFDPDLTEATVYPLLRYFYRQYFRIDTTGVEHLPPEGPALIVANHSGTLPVDALMLSIAVHDETPHHRFLRLLGADLVFRIPIVSELSRKFGSTLACNADAERLLQVGEYVGVFPEGFKGVGKPYRERYRLQRFGRGGFVAAALRTGTPIVPAAIVGAEEIYPLLGNIKPLAKVLGFPYLPVTPLFPWLGPLGAVPLPSKWLIEFGQPIDTASYDGDPEDPLVVFNLADEVRETIQQTLHELLQRRPDPFG